MATITFELPDDLAEQLLPEKSRLSEVLAECLGRTPLVVQAYQRVLEFLVSDLLPEQLAAFSLTPEMMANFHALKVKKQKGELTPTEEIRLADYQKLERVIRMAKAGELSFMRNKH